MAYYDGGKIKKSPEVEELNWECMDNAINEMSEDEIGKKIVRKVLEKIRHNEKI
jgi:NAD+ diphosphatase